MVSHVWFNANDMSFCRGRGINSGLSREIEKRKTHPIDWHRLCEWNSVLWKKKQTPVSVHGRLKFMPSGRLCSHHGVMCVPLQGFQWLVTCYIYSPGMVQVLVQESGLRGTWQLAKKKKKEGEEKQPQQLSLMVSTWRQGRWCNFKAAEIDSRYCLLRDDMLWYQ